MTKGCVQESYFHLSTPFLLTDVIKDLIASLKENVPEYHNCLTIRHARMLRGVYSAFMFILC